MADQLQTDSFPVSGSLAFMAASLGTSLAFLFNIVGMETGSSLPMPEFSILILTAPVGSQVMRLLQGMIWSGPFLYSPKSLLSAIMPCLVSGDLTCLSTDVTSLIFVCFWSVQPCLVSGDLTCLSTDVTSLIFVCF